MSNARDHAKILAAEALEELIGASQAGGAAIANETIKRVVRLVIFSIIMSVIFKMCR